MKLDLKLYRGYANDSELVVFGHVFKSWAPDKYRMDRRSIRHAVSIIHMFRIKPISNIEVTLRFKGMEITTKSMDDGYFGFHIPYSEELESGWHTYEVVCKMGPFGIVETSEFLKPYPGELGIITDIDDTFMISHSGNFFKKLYVLLLRNIDRRKVFDDVAIHYQALSRAGQNGESSSNSFFYVSSSEWNLYEFIDSFSKMHNLPKAIIKLKEIKSGITDFLFTGRGNHDHKFQKIKEIILFYPGLQYVLLGDDSQQDPYIYERIVKIFPRSILAVYIRQTSSKKNKSVLAVLHNIETMSTSTCYFKKSEKAIEHSKRIKII